MTIKREKFLIKTNKALLEEVRELKSIIASNAKMMDDVAPILECVVPYVDFHSVDIKDSINDFGTLQPALDAILNMESNDE